MEQKSKTLTEERNELLWEILDELDNVLSLHNITKGLPALADKITALLKEINVERT